MEVVVNEEYPGDVQDLSGIIQRMKAEDVDLFFALTLPNDGALMARTVEELDFNPTIYCSCGSQVTSLASWPDLGSAANGVMSTGMAWPESDDYPELDLLWEAVQAQLGYPDMPQYIPVGYSILQVMEQAVNGTGGLDQAALRDFVLGNSFETANGPFNYGDAGTPGYNAILLQYLADEGGNVVVWPEDRSTGDPVIPKP
jgi:branched-chain amino acid transport system substrate-binding protein